jgi:signal peptidase I
MEDDPGTLASARTPDSGQDAKEPGADALESGADLPEDPGTTEGSRTSKGKKKHFWRELLVIVVAAAVLTLLVKAFVVQVYRIPSASMENTLQIGDRVLVNKLVYHFRGIDRGDIVVFSGQDSWGPDAPPPSGNPLVRLYDAVLSDIGLASSQTYYIKRVIGLPGDHVACCTGGKVTVNGVPLSEGSYIYPGDAPSFKFQATVPSGHLWVMGDHRGDSDDSRYHIGNPGGGAVPESEVVGRAFLVIWPLSQVRDLPIPPTFQQAALSAVAAIPVTGAAGAAGAIAAPLLFIRHRRRRR